MMKKVLIGAAYFAVAFVILVAMTFLKYLIGV